MSNSKITKAVLACGGWSTRFLPTTKSYAKQLLPVMEKPQILYALDECINSGITQICIVHRDNELTINQFLSPNSELDEYLKTTNKGQRMDDYNRIVGQITKLEFLPQTDNFPYGNGSPILVAQNFINNEPFAYFYADDFVLENKTGDYLNSIVNTFTSQSADAVCAVAPTPMEVIHLYSSVKYSEGNRMESVIEKPEASVAPSNHAMFGRFAFSPKIIEILKNTTTARGELWLTDAVNNMAADKNNLVLTQVVPDGSKWMTTGDPLNWLKVNIAVALKDENIAPNIKDYLKSL
jgi:UTP--glucose-1-phosphate uridylyltransferase